MEINLSDYDWYDDGPDFFYAIDKKGKVYGLNRKGELTQLEDETSDSKYGWQRAAMDEVEQVIKARKAKAKNKRSKT